MTKNKYYIRYVFIFYILCFLTHYITAFDGKYPIQSFSPSDYKAGIQNIDFAQNRDMTIFVANNLGVLAYNGNEWKVKTHQAGKKQRSLAFDESSDRLYIGSQGSFGFFQNDWDYVSLVEKIPEGSQDFDEVWDVFLLNSKAYFCTFQAIYVYDGQDVSVIEQAGGFNRSFQVNEKLFVQSEVGQLFEIKANQLVPTYPQQHLGQIVTGIIPHESGYLFFYNSGEIEFSTSFGVTKKYDDLIKALSGKYVNHVLQLSDTRLAISTQTAGLFLYDLKEGVLENITIQDGLQSNACLRAFQAHSGKLWVGLQNGIALIDIHAPMRFINQEIDLHGSGYEAFEIEEGTYYSTSNGIYFLSESSTRSVILPGTEGPAYGMQKIMGKLYAGHHTGLFLLEDGKASRIAHTEGLWKIKQLRSHPEFAIGGTYSGLFLFHIDAKRELKAVRKIDGFNESSRFFEEDHQGRIWVGQFYKGLYQLTLSEGMTEAAVKKIPDNYDTPINEHIILSRIDNELYLATRSGVYRLDQSTDQIVEATLFSEIIGKQTVNLLVQDNQKNIHVFTREQVGFYKQISASNYQFVPSSMSQQRYSFNNDLLYISVNTRNGILFNANEGFIKYIPELENRAIMDKPLVISRVFSISEDSVLYTQKPFEVRPENIDKLFVSQRDKVLQFEVEPFEFNEVYNQQFRYYLKGFDNDYGEWTNRTVKEYTNLESGDYELFVQTRNYQGEVVTSLPLPLSVKPPFYSSLLAKFIYIGLGFLSLSLILRYQKRRYNKKAELVEKSKLEELERKQEELIKIEQDKEQELLQLEEDKVKSELRHLNNLLAASTMNLVVKNEFIETIKEKLLEVNRKGKNKEINESLKQIVKDINTTLRIQEDWEQFEYHLDRVHGDFLSRLRTEFLDLTPNEQKLCAFLRLKLNTKDIANLMGISLRGVEVARYRLRKKLDLNKRENLSKFVLEY